MHFFLNLYTHIHQADFKQLLNGKQFIVIQGQLIFEKDGEIVITHIDSNKSDFTAEHYKALPEGAPYQLINGKLHYMPSPTEKYQRTQSLIHFYLFDFIDSNDLGKLYTAPLDVYFDDDNVYQPDLMFISNKRSNIIETFIKGAPDLVIEILSRGTAKVDREDKLKKYGETNVLEYWIVDPEKKAIELYSNDGKELKKEATYEYDSNLKSKVLAGFSINTKQIFR